MGLYLGPGLNSLIPYYHWKNINFHLQHSFRVGLFF